MRAVEAHFRNQDKNDIQHFAKMHYVIVTYDRKGNTTVHEMDNLKLNPHARPTPPLPHHMSNVAAQACFEALYLLKYILQETQGERLIVFVAPKGEKKDKDIASGATWKQTNEEPPTYFEGQPGYRASAFFKIHIYNPTPSDAVEKAARDTINSLATIMACAATKAGIKDALQKGVS
ncbi:MAG: hypothetical protein H7A36_05375 [Chlamydiales bacterium]|nr:hypothetical protein [Chlamydiales bacterium]